MTDIPQAGRPHGPFEAAQGGIIHAAREAIFVVDENQRIVMINPAAQRMFGCSASDALGRDLSLFIPQQYRQAHATHMRQFDASGVVERPMGTRGAISGLRANGEEFPAEATICRLDVVDEFGPRRYFTALLRDLSEEQRLQAEIDALNKSMRTIFELAPIAIWVTRGDQIVYANHACAALFGATESKVLVTRSIYSLLSPQSHRTVREKVAQALVTEASVHVINECIVRSDGAVREVEIAVAALPDHGQTAVQMVITDVTQRVQERQELERSRRELRRLSASLVDTREEERRRISRELHDELGQRLTALKMELASLTSQRQPGALEARMASMIDMVDDTVVAVRRIATELRPLMLDDLGLNAAIEWLARDSARRMGVEITLHLADDAPPVSDEVAIALFRMVQEALTNIARHAQASAAHIETQRRASEVVLTVQDNGVGFTGQAILREDSHGLVGMRERAFMLGGAMEIGNLPGGGTRITVRLPVHRAVSQRHGGQGDAASAIGGLVTPETAAEP
ncbi:MAG: PAS domain-containing sensor histidine kinase [Burkholderiaceae bacterium]|nr:PAS domain-containing sensor histidine kinase [Burkholderiaceae bacterium]